jgi:response regulator of citrate/malate metabolism
MSLDSLRHVVEALRARPEGLSATEAGSLIGVSRVTARRYLEYLHACGVVDRGARYGGAGRPEVEYRLRPSENSGSGERHEPRVGEDRPL